VYALIQVVGRIVEIADNRHSVDGVGTCGRPQWLFDADFCFWYKGYIWLGSLSRPLIFFFIAHINFQKTYSPFHSL
jgi:hypothetical protein